MVRIATIRNFARPKARFAFAQNSALAFEIVFNWDFAKRSRNRRSFARVAFTNSRSFDQFAMNRGQNCGYLQSRLWCPCPCSSDKDLRIRADKVCVFMLSVGEIPSSTLFRYRQDSAPTDKPHRREFRPRFFFLDIGRIHAYKPISPSPWQGA